MGLERIPLTHWTKSRRKQTARVTSWSTSFSVTECKIWKLNSQTGNKINTIFTNNSTHDTGIQLTGCIVFQQKAWGRILRPCAFILPFPPFSPVSTVILCREGKTPRKSALKNQNEIFPKPSPGGLAAVGGLSLSCTPAPREKLWVCNFPWTCIFKVWCLPQNLLELFRLSRNFLVIAFLCG